jgi:hypothetical protein
MKRVLLATAILALVLSGGAVAASQITSSQIKNGTIKAADISKSAKRTLKGNRGPRGFTGAQGTQGLPGPGGPAGPAGPTGVAAIVSAQGTGIGSAHAACPAGTRPISGGGIEEGTGYLWASGIARNDAGQLGWLVAGDADSPVSAYVYCSAGVSSFTFPNGSPALKVSAVRAELARRR